MVVVVGVGGVGVVGVGVAAVVGVGVAAVVGVGVAAVVGVGVAVGVGEGTAPNCPDSIMLTRVCRSRPGKMPWSCESRPSRSGMLGSPLICFRRLGAASNPCKYWSMSFHRISQL